MVAVPSWTRRVWLSVVETSSEALGKALSISDMQDIWYATPVKGLVDPQSNCDSQWRPTGVDLCSVHWALLQSRFQQGKGVRGSPESILCITSMWLAWAGAARLTLLHWPEHGQPPIARTSQYFVPMPTGSIQALGKVTRPVKTIHSLNTYNFNSWSLWYVWLVAKNIVSNRQFSKDEIQIVNIKKCKNTPNIR